MRVVSISGGPGGLYFSILMNVLDAFMRAEEQRTNSIKTPVFKAPRRFSRLREQTRVHSMLVRDVVRVQSRIKAM